VNANAADTVRFRSRGERLTVNVPFHCDNPAEVDLGEDVFINIHCLFVVTQPASIRIGDRAKIGPGVHIYSDTHPMNPQERFNTPAHSYSVTIGDDVWVGGGAIILPGVTIGDRAVIGAGAIVTRDVPPDVFAAGNPCRVIRNLT
jgi:maltose O-acetyltransferase